MVEVKREFILYFERPLEKSGNDCGLSKQLEKHWAQRRHYTQAASIESVSLLW